jgi:hypothetical protein
MLGSMRRVARETETVIIQEHNGQLAAIPIITE